MTVNYRPLKSAYGFESPGFSVSATGQLTITSGGILEFNDRVDINDSLYVSTQIYIDNVPLLDLTDPLINKLSPLITESSLTKLDTLQELSVLGNVDIKDSLGNNNVIITNGNISVTSVTLGTIDNIEIGSITPADAYFNDLFVGSLGNNKELNVQGTVVVSTSLDVPTITNTTLTSTTGNITTVTATNVNTTNATVDSATIDVISSQDITADDIIINNTPTTANQATRKDYVDNKISAFAIVFGA